MSELMEEINVLKGEKVRGPARAQGLFFRMQSQLQWRVHIDC